MKKKKNLPQSLILTPYSIHKCQINVNVNEVLLYTSLSGQKKIFFFMFPSVLHYLSSHNWNEKKRRKIEPTYVNVLFAVGHNDRRNILSDSFLLSFFFELENPLLLFLLEKSLQRNGIYEGKPPRIQKRKL